jgi:cytochrome oxidase Cu insertion factor (SCO1/SenC/PrrC family)
MGRSMKDLDTTYTEKSWRTRHNLRLIALFLILSASFATITVYPSGSPAPALQASSPASDFRSIELMDVNGNSIYLKDFEGKVVVLEFMATWCTSCAQQEQILKNEFYPAYNDKNVVILSVSVDPTYDTQDVLRDHIAKKGVGWLMTRDTTLTLTNYFKVTELSTILIINPVGKVTATFVGPTDMATLSKTVDPLL